MQTGAKKNKLVKRCGGKSGSKLYFNIQKRMKFSFQSGRLFERHSKKKKQDKK